MQRVLPVLLAAAMASSAGHAGPIFGRKQPMQNPTKVAELLNTLRNGQSGERRAAAASDLAGADGQMFPEVAPALIQALLQDKDSSVRRAAAVALGQLEPRSAEAANALDACLKNEGNLLVRLAARTARLGYRVPDNKPAADPEKPTVIQVPPPDANGRLRPVPVPNATPSNPNVNQTRPLPSAPETRGPIVAPPAQPILPVSTSPSPRITVPLPPPPKPAPVEGPILLPPG